VGRAERDLPDDHAGPQVHVMYVVPGDGVDARRDVDGSIERSVASSNGWLRRASGGTAFRLDTCEGRLDVTFVELEEKEVDIAARTPYVRDRIQTLLIEQGIVEPSKLYAIYYEGSTTQSCGAASWPPTLPGQVVALFLRGTPAGARPCVENVLGGAVETPAYLEFAMLHELFHAVGGAPECAPNHTLAGHVSDDPADLMYAGTEEWRPSLLDRGGDDYFRHGRPGCLDVASSAFLEPAAPGATLPPAWPGQAR
jgi:hypothetical protein